MTRATTKEVFFAVDESKATIEEVVNCLRMPELKLLAKDMKVKVVDLKVQLSLAVLSLLNPA